MGDDKLRILITRLLPELDQLSQSYLLYAQSIPNSKFDYVLHLAKEQIPDLEPFIYSIQKRSQDFAVGDAVRCCKYILEILDLEHTFKINVDDNNIFQGARDKLNEASTCFRNDEYVGTINNLNTCLELLLKEKFRIPTTIKGINTAKIIELAIKYDLGPIKFFEQARKHVTDVDNKIKHVGYTPSKSDTIHAIKSMEELSRELENCSIELTDQIINKIYSGI